MDIELRNIHKSFGEVHANAGINLNVASGSLQGILGENGAGKSTLMKILSGFFQQDRGEILLDGTPVRIDSPADAIQRGVGMLHQDPLDFPPLTVIDNFVIGRPGGLSPDRDEGRAALQELSAEFGFSLDPDAYVESLTVGERQQLEILRLLWLGARVLILDEPTTGISQQQKVKLFNTLKRLASEGRTILFVSHKLEEVEDLCDRVAVLREGRLVGGQEQPFDLDELVEMMFGEEVSVGARAQVDFGEEVLRLDDVSLEDRQADITGVDLSVRRGEVIGLAGMEGSGQSALLAACAGLIRPVEGRVIVAGSDLTGEPYREFLRHGVVHMPAARLEEGLIPGLSLTEHFLLVQGGEGPVIDWQRGRALARERIEHFSIVGSPSSPVESLSGGNQQRALLALLRPNRKLILMEHPTRGLDIESALWVWGELKNRCREGTAIFFISSDLEEILQYSDRILVFFGGRVSAPLDAENTSLDKLGRLIGGRGFDEARKGPVDG
ncbi:MAG: ATP-binding cassette domain-containing protein [Anaerolineales bacterium]|nr:ATP-binding cassette domain-containing protein [Anaerolineales bacterium]